MTINQTNITMAATITCVFSALCIGLSKAFDMDVSTFYGTTILYFILLDRAERYV